MISKQKFIDKILKKPKLICLLAVEWFQVFLSKLNNFIIISGSINRLFELS